MVNGIASLRGYQEIPDVYAKMLAAIRSGASQQALPDTLKGEQRAQMMRDLHEMGADTAQINQQGFYNLFTDELPELLEFFKKTTILVPTETSYTVSHYLIPRIPVTSCCAKRLGCRFTIGQAVE